MTSPMCWSIACAASFAWACGDGSGRGDGAPADTPDETLGDGSDEGAPCPGCGGTVVQAERAEGGFSVQCPTGTLTDFSGTRYWSGPGMDLSLHACGDFTTPAGEAGFYVCCIATPDGGTDGDGEVSGEAAADAAGG